MDRAKLFEHDKSTIGSRLIRWGEWKRGSGRSNGYPYRSAFLNNMPPSYDNKWLGEVLDSECRETESAVILLESKHQEIIRIEYYYCCKDRNVKLTMTGLSKHSYYKFLGDAKYLVAEKLNLNLHSSDKSDIKLLSCV